MRRRVLVNRKNAAYKCVLQLFGFTKIRAINHLDRASPRSCRQIPSVLMRRDFCKQPISKSLHFALTNGIRRIDDVEARNGFQRVCKRSNQSPGSEIGRNEHGSTKHHAFPLRCGLHGKGGRVKGQPAMRIHAFDTGAGEPGCPVDRKRISRACPNRSQRPRVVQYMSLQPTRVA